VGEHGLMTRMCSDGIQELVATAGVTGHGD
jgi:hypothetical protein